jgi:hypothetical protein
MSEVIGKVIVLGNTEEVGQNGFTKRVIVVETSEQYPQKLAIDFVKDKCSILDNYKVGDEVKVSVNLRGTEYNGRYFVNLQGWRIEKMQAEEPQAYHSNHPTNMPPANQASPQPYEGNEEEYDDLPF